MLKTRIADKRIRIKKAGDDKRIKSAALRFFMQFVNKVIPVDNRERNVYFSPDPRTISRKETKSRINAWAEYAIHAVTSSGKET